MNENDEGMLLPLQPSDEVSLATRSRAAGELFIPLVVGAASLHSGKTITVTAKRNVRVTCKEQSDLVIEMEKGNKVVLESRQQPNVVFEYPSVTVEHSSVWRWRIVQ